MSPIIILLWVKIAITLAMLVVPFSLLPADRITKMSGFGDAAPGFFRLYGLVMLALCVAYYSGIETAKTGIFPTTIVVMGIVSNAGGALLPLFGRFEKRNWAAIGIFGAIAIFLTIMLMSPEWAIKSL